MQRMRKMNTSSVLYCIGHDHANLVQMNSDNFDRKRHDFVSRLKTMAGDRDDDQDDLKMSIAFSFVLEDNETGIGF